jgi:hypothetical protein
LSDVIRVRLGDYIPLIAVVSNGDQDKVIKVDLYNQDTGALLTTTPITLALVAPGYYQDNSYLMPPVKRVLALMNVFESDGTTPSTDTEQVGTALFEINDASTDTQDSSGGGAVTFYIGSYADFLFLSDTIITPDMITVFYIQEDIAASVTSSNHEPFLNLKDTTLTLVPNGNAPVHFQFPDHLTSSLELASYMNLQVSASGYAGLSGFGTSAKNGFLILETNNTGQLATLDITEANAPLGIALQSTAGEEQKKVVMLDVNVEVKTVGDNQLVTFLVTSDFNAGELYFVEFNDGIRKSLQKFTVLRKKNQATVNFVAKMP